jgi:hypothetical protein
MPIQTRALGRSYLDNAELPELLRQLEYVPLPYDDGQHRCSARRASARRAHALRPFLGLLEGLVEQLATRCHAVETATVWRVPLRSLDD